VNKFLLEVNGVVGFLFKACASYSVAHLYLREIFVKEKKDPVPQDVALADFPPSLPEGAYRPLPYPLRRKEAIFSRTACCIFEGAV
jgi:hypothetical protein